MQIKKVKKSEYYENHNLMITTYLGTHVLPSNLGRAFKRCLDTVEVDKIRFHDLRGMLVCYSH